MNELKLVIDTSVFFSILLSRDGGIRRQILTERHRTYYSPRFVLIELFKHKERIAAASELQPEALLECLHEMLARIDLMDEAGIPIGTWLEARRLCREVDLKDTPFVALTLHVDGRLWTSDEELKAGLRRKGFNRFFEG